MTIVNKKNGKLEDFGGSGEVIKVEGNKALIKIGKDVAKWMNVPEGTVVRTPVVLDKRIFG